MAELLIQKSNRDDAIALIARKMSRQNIEHYLKIARGSVSKSFSAIFIGTLIATFGITLEYLVMRAYLYELLGSTYPPPRLIVARVLFIFIGGYLVVQGMLCLIEARTQSIVMSKALRRKLKLEEQQ